MFDRGAVAEPLGALGHAHAQRPQWNLRNPVSWLSIRTFRRPNAVGISVGDDEGLPASSVHDPSKSLTLADVLYALYKRRMHARKHARPPALPPSHPHARTQTHI